MKNIDFKKINWHKVFSLRTAMVVFLGASLYAQLDHTAYVVEHLARKSASGTHAYAFALAVELSVLLFVLAGHKRISWLFALATFATNLSFYWVQLDGQWQSADAPMAVLMALLLPGVIIGYSHSVAQRHDEGAQGDAKTDEVVEHDDAVVAQTTQVVAQSSEELAQYDEEPAQTTPKMSAEQRRLHIKEQGLTDAALIAAQYGISKRQAQEDLRKIREAGAELHNPIVMVGEVRAQVMQTNGKSAH